MPKESALEKKLEPGQRGDGLLAGVDEVRIDLVVGREGPDAEQAVLRLQVHGHARGDVVGDQGRDADAQVHVEAVAQLLRRALRHQVADRRVLLRRGRARDGAELDALLVLRALDDAVDVDARRVDLVGIELAHLHQLLDLGHRHLAAGGDHRVEVARGLAVDEVARLVALPGLDDGEVGADRLLEHVLAAVERRGCPCLRRAWCRRRCACRSRGCRRRPRGTSPPACPAASAAARARRRAPGARTPCSRPRTRRSPSSPGGVFSSSPMPKSSTPALLPAMVRPFTPLSTSAAIRFSGMPHRPKPPAAMVMSSLQQARQGGLGVRINLVHFLASLMVCGMRIGCCFSMSMNTTVAAPSA